MITASRVPLIFAVVCMALTASVLSGEPAQADAPTPARVDQGLLNSPGLRVPGAQVPLGISSAPGMAAVGQRAELTRARTSNSSTWLNSDGSETVEDFPQPKFYQPFKSAPWLPIDTSLAPSSGKDDGTFVSGQSSDSVLFAPAGTLGGSEEFNVNGVQFGFSPIGVSDVTDRPIASGSTATYSELWPHSNVTAEVTTGGVIEDITITGPGAQADFVYGVSGASLRPADSGSVQIMAGDSTIGTIPAPTVSVSHSTSGNVASSSEYASAVDATVASGAHLTVVGGRLVISVSSSWLANLPASAYPVVIDPYVQYSGTAYQSVSYSNLGAQSNGVVRVGTDSSGSHWVAASYFPVPAAPAASAGAPPWQLTTSTIQGFASGSATFSGLNIYGESNAYSSVPSAASLASGSLLASVSGAGIGQDATAWFKTHMTGSWIGFTGDTSGGNSANGAGTTISPLAGYFTYVQNVAPTTFVSPASGSVISALTPTLQAQTVTSSDGSTVWYDFKLSTSANGSGPVVDSGWLTQPQWSVPAGGLVDGANYYATVLDSTSSPTVAPTDSFYYAPAAPNAPLQFAVKLRLGGGGPSPTDTVGAAPGGADTPSAALPSPGTSPSSETVNLLTGNLSVAISSHTVSAVGGMAGISLSYNSAQSSIAAGTNFGLTGQYYLDNGHTHVFPSVAVGQRNDPGVNLAGTPGVAPIGGMSPSTSGFMVRWAGQIRLPAGTWKLGGVTTGGMRIYLNGSATASYDDWTGSASSTSVGYGSSTVAGSQSYSIEVDYWEASANVPNVNTVVQLWAKNTASTNAASVAPVSWFAPTGNGLPTGWTLTPSATSGVWTGLIDEGAQVVLQSATGATASFTQTPDGLYHAPAGDTDFLSRNGSGQLQLSTASNYLYVFTPTGALSSLSTISDDRHPAALVYGYSGAPNVLRTITDPVSLRTVNIYYGGDSACPLSHPAPTGLLCEVTTWDGQSTGFGYNANGQLAEVDAPGAQTTLLGYDSDNRLDEIRDALAFDYIAADIAGTPTSCQSNLGTSCPLDTSVSYDSQGRVAQVMEPTPTVGGTRPSRTYTYGTTQGSVLIAGLSSAVTYSQTATFDANGRVISTAAWNTAPSYMAWDSSDRPIVQVTSSGTQTSTIFDAGGHATDIWGPAPTACFSGGWPVGSSQPPFSAAPGYLPVTNPSGTTGCGLSAVPHSTSTYDAGVTGLAATYWSNGQLAGAPVLHSDGKNSGAACSTAGDSACMSWSGSAPVSTDANGAWSMRMSGLFNAGSARPYSLGLTTEQPATLYVDGVQLAQETSSQSGSQNSQYFVQGTVSLTAGEHVIQIDYVGANNANNMVMLDQYTASQWIPVANSFLDPNYGLLTATTDADGKTTSTAYKSADGNVGSYDGLPVTMTQDPGGLGLTTTNTYQTGGTSSFFNVVSTTLPAGTTTSYTYYSGTGGPVAAACGVSASTVQGGQMASETDPIPAVGVSPREQQFIYDAQGRAVGHRTGPANVISTLGWDCISYDNRGRLAAQSWAAYAGSAARTVTYSYAIGGNPLASSVSDTSSSITITSTVDLLGRIVKYVDGTFVNTATYNQAGQVTSTTGPQGTLTDTYADSGELATISLGTTAPTVLASASYDAGGRLHLVQYSDGDEMFTQYDPYGNLDEKTYTDSDGDAHDIEATYFSPAGRAVRDLNFNGQSVANPDPTSLSTIDYTYDGAGRLTFAWLGNSAKANYGYSTNPGSDNCTTPGAGANSDRTSVTVTPYLGTASTTDSCFNNADQLTATVAGGTTDSRYAYDGRGNQTDDAGSTMTWDSSSRLTSTTSPTGSSTLYTYDAVDRLARETSGASVANYVYGGLSDAAIASADASGGIKQAFIALPGGVTVTVAISSAAQTWLYTDVRGNANIEVNGSGTQVGGRQSYDPWGASLSTGTLEPGGSDTSYLGAFATAGKFTNNISGLVILGARAFNPVEGRFLSEDPILGGCANNYVYAHGDPLSQEDTSGSKCKKKSGSDGFWATFGIGLGIAAVVLGIAAIVLTGGAALVVGAAAVAAGVGATALDYRPCINEHEAASCVGLAAGTAGTLVAGGGFAAGVVETVAGADTATGLTAGLTSRGLGITGAQVGGYGTAYDAGVAATHKSKC